MKNSPGPFYGKRLGLFAVNCCCSRKNGVNFALLKPKTSIPGSAEIAPQ